MRATAVVGGLGALALALAAFGFARWATGEESVVGTLGKAVVLAVAGGGILAACGGLTVAAHGIAARARLLHGLAVLLAVASYGLALGIAEIA